MPFGSLRSIADRLDQAKALERAQRAAFLQIVAGLPQPVSKCLSVSTGDGIWDYLALNSGVVRAITATDIVPCAVRSPDVEMLRSLGSWDFVQVAAEQPLPFKDNEFEMAYHVDVIEHVRRPTLFLQEQFRVLKSGGTVIVGTPNLLRPTNIAKAVLGKLYFPVKIGENPEIGEYIHIQEFSCWAIENLLSEAGFIEIKYVPAFFGLHFLNWTFSKLPATAIGKTLAHFHFTTGRKP